jgi:glycopeptide antibiotics resistance protein
VLSIRPALLLYAGVVCLEWGKGKKISVEISMLWEYFWLLWLITILHASGIVGTRADWLWAFKTGTGFGIELYRGSPSGMLLNVLLFVPYGFLTPFALKKSGRSLLRAARLGILTSAVIATLRLSFGLGAAVADVVLNAAGTMLGFLLAKLGRACHKKSNTPIDSPPA